MADRENVEKRPPSRPGSTQRELWSGIDQASIMSVELIAAILTWTGIGWLVDQWLGTAPWFLVSGAMIGNAAGLYLIWLRSKRDEERWNAARDQGRAPGGGNDDERREGGTGDGT